MLNINWKDISFEQVTCVQISIKGQTCCILQLGNPLINKLLHIWFIEKCHLLMSNTVSWLILVISVNSPAKLKKKLNDL